MTLFDCREIKAMRLTICSWIRTITSSEIFIVTKNYIIYDVSDNKLKSWTTNIFRPEHSITYKCKIKVYIEYQLFLNS